MSTQRHRHSRRGSPEATRQRIIAAAFEEFYQRGYQASTIDGIVERAGVTKGALFHHFRDKMELGFAVLDHVRSAILEVYVQPVLASDDPLRAVRETFRRREVLVPDDRIQLGCPLNNLTQEMAHLDQGFRDRIAAILSDWTGAYAEALGKAQRQGQLRHDVDTSRVAALIVAAIEGSFGAAKAARSVEVLRTNLETLADLLESLRPLEAARSGPSAT